MLHALEEGRILRTWPMRGTIHLVPSTDAAWMLTLMAGRALSAAAGRWERLGLSRADAERATSAMVQALAGGRRLTRAEALAVINDAGISTEGQRGYHLLWYAAQTGVICIGPQADGAQTFVLLDEWAPTPRRLEGAEAAAELAFRYFRSHGPTTVQDFAGWTGLGLTVSRRAVADNDGRLTPAAHGRRDGLGGGRCHGRWGARRTLETRAGPPRLRRAHARLQGPLAARAGRPLRRGRPGRQRDLPLDGRHRRSRPGHVGTHDQRQHGEGRPRPVRADDHAADRCRRAGVRGVRGLPRPTPRPHDQRPRSESCRVRSCGPFR